MNERDQESFIFLLADLFQIMLLPRRPRPMTPQVNIKDVQDGVCEELYATFEIAELQVNKQIFHHEI